MSKATLYFIVLSRLWDLSVCHCTGRFYAGIGDCLSQASGISR